MPQVTGAFVGNGGAFGPIEYAGSLYIIALASIADTESDESSIGIFESTDGGATWSQTGSTITIPSAEDVGGIYGSVATRDPEFFHGCLDVDFPAEPYAYIIHSGLSGGFGCLFVSRFNATLEDFDMTSSAGPEIPFATALGNHDFLGWMIAQSSDRSFGVLANLNSAGSSTDRVYAMSLNEGLSSWSSRAEVAGQTNDFSYTASGISRGVSGLVHGWIEAQGVSFDSDHFVMYHTIVVGGGGSIGSALQDVYSLYDTAGITTGTKIFQSPYTGAFLDGKVYFIGAGGAIGIGSQYNLISAVAGSEEEPTWEIKTIDDNDVAENSYWAGIASNDTSVVVCYNINNTFDNVLQSFNFGADWSEPSEAVSIAEPFFIGGLMFSLGFGVTFGQGDYDLWFETSGAGGATIVGSAGIPSEEAFGKTHGVFGGGEPETCGAPVPIPPAVPCQQIPVTPAYPGGQDSCPTSGYSF